MYPFSSFNTKDVSSFSTANSFNAPRPFGTPGPFGNPPTPSNNVFGSAVKNITPFAPSTNQPVGSMFPPMGNTSVNNNASNAFQNFSNYNNPQGTFGNFSNSSYGNSFNKPSPFSLEPEKNYMKCESMKFTPKMISETVMRDNHPVNLQLRLQNICGMNGYENQSFEEVRQADYLANRKEPQQGSSIIKTNMFTTPTNAFGNQNNNANTNNKLPFSNTTTSGFGNVGGSKPNTFFGSSLQTNTSTLPNRTNMENSFFSQSFTPQNNTFNNNAPTSTCSPSFGFPATMNNFGMKPATDNATGQSEFPKLFGNQPEKNISFTQQPTQGQMLFNTQTNSNPIQFNNKQPTMSGLPSFSGNTLNKPAASPFPLPSTPYLPSNQASTNFNFHSFGQPLINQNASQPINNYKPNFPTFSQPENRPTPQNIVPFPMTNFQNNTFEINNMNKFQSLSTPLTTTLSYDNIHERMISLSQQYPTPPLLKGLTPLYEEINIPLKTTSNPETIEKILQEQLSLTKKDVAKTPLRSRLKSFEAPLFDGLEFDSDGGNVELNRKKCPRRLFIAQYVPIESKQQERLEHVTEDVSCNNEKDISEKDERTFKPESTQTEPIVEKISPKSTSDPCRFVKTLFQLTPAKKKDSVENFPALTYSDIKLSQELNDKNDTNVHPTKIINTRENYYTIPSLDELIAFIDDNTGKCMVKGFTIGRLGYGSIYFFDEFDVTGINIDELVIFEHKEVTVYPNGNEPPVGTELNRRCKITLERVWPTNKDTKEQIVDVKQIEESNFVEVLKRVNSSYKTEFVDYKPETGTWIFISPNFSSN